MNLDIDRLNLRLPSALAPRAHRIARAVGESLGGLQGLPSARIDQLVLPALRLDPATSDAEIGAAVAAALHQALTMRDGQP